MDEQAEIETIRRLRELIAELSGSLQVLVLASHEMVTRNSSAIYVDERNKVHEAIARANAVLQIVNPPPPQPKE